MGDETVFGFWFQALRRSEYVKIIKPSWPLPHLLQTWILLCAQFLLLIISPTYSQFSAKQNLFPFPRKISFPGLRVAQVLISNSNRPAPLSPLALDFFFFFFFNLNRPLYSFISLYLPTKSTRRETLLPWSQNLQPQFLFLPTSSP